MLGLSARRPRTPTRKPRAPATRVRARDLANVLRGIRMLGLGPLETIATADIVREHVRRVTLHEEQLIPAHGQRRASPAYRTTRQRLIAERGCVLCGVTQATLRDPKRNPFGAKQMETHHRLVEWSFTKAVDLAKFNTRVLPGLRRTHPDRALYAHDLTQQELEAWIDADADNMWVLCDVHHRHVGVGIHMVSGPEWGPQDLLLDRFQAHQPAPSEPPRKRTQRTPLPRGGRRPR